MKKLYSLIFSICILFCAVFSVPHIAVADIKKPATEINITEVKTLSVNATDKISRLSFTPETTGYFEFIAWCSSSSVALGAIVDASDELIAQNVYNGGDKFITAGYLEAGNLYYYELEGTGSDFSANIELKEHRHSFTDQQKYVAVYDSNDTLLCDDGGCYNFCNVCGEYQTVELYYYAKSAALKTSTFTYNGKAKTTTVTVKDRMGNTLPSSSYTVKYKNNKNPGYATVTITLRGNYSGSFVKKMTIKPAKLSVSSLKLSGINGFTATWKKDSKITGYQLRYSTSEKFTDKTTSTVNIGSKSTSKTIKKLKKNKKYYVQLRSYKTADGKKIYSDWSKTKTIKTKK